MFGGKKKRLIGKRPPDKLTQIKKVLADGEKKSGKVVRAFTKLMREDSEED